MPMYEYQCERCSEQFALLQTVSVRPGETICPKCGTPHVKKLFSTFASKVSGGSSTGFTGGGHTCPPSGCGC